MTWEIIPLLAVLLYSFWKIVAAIARHESEDNR